MIFPPDLTGVNLQLIPSCLPTHAVSRGFEKQQHFDSLSIHRHLIMMAKTWIRTVGWGGFECSAKKFDSESSGLPAPARDCRGGSMIDDKGPNVFFPELSGFLDLGFARGDHSHLPLRQRFSVGFYQPDSAGEAIDLVGGVHGSARRRDRVHAAEDQGEEQS